MVIKDNSLRVMCNLGFCHGKVAKFAVKQSENSHNAAADLFLCPDCLEGIAMSMPDEIMKKVIAARPELLEGIAMSDDNTDKDTKPNNDTKDSNQNANTQEVTPQKLCGQCIRKFNKKSEEPCLTCKEEFKLTKEYPSFEPITKE